MRGPKSTDVELQYLKDDTLIRLVENDISGGPIYVESYDQQKVLDIDANNLYGWELSEKLSYLKLNLKKNMILMKY